MNKISVIIPCCNVERWIDRCMTSITSQTIGMGNLEIICVDDASADDTWGHLKEWERSFPENVRLIQLEVNLRQGAARNMGCDMHLLIGLLLWMQMTGWNQIILNYYIQLPQIIFAM